MNGRFLTHVLLLLAMLVSQMATHAHMIDHVTDRMADRSADHATGHLNDHMAAHMAIATIDCDPSAHQPDHHHHNALTLETSNDDESKADCSIYHAYSGVYGISTAERVEIDLNTEHVLVKQVLRSPIIGQPLTAHLIRGPPLHS